MQPSSHRLAAALCTVQGLQILLCGAQVQPGFMRLAVLLVELGFFRNKLFPLGFELFRAWQLGNVVGLEIGGCLLVSC